MAALPPFLGFVAKEADLTTLAESPSLGAAAPYVLAGVAFGSVFTTIYSLRFVYGAFARKGRAEPSQRVAEMHRPTALIPGRPGDPGGGRPGVRRLADRAGPTSSTSTRTPFPARPTTTSPCGTA